MVWRSAPGAALDAQIDGLGESLIGRTKMLASDISHNNRKIEKQRSQMVLHNIVWGAAFAAWMLWAAW